MVWLCRTAWREFAEGPAPAATTRRVDRPVAPHLLPFRGPPLPRPARRHGQLGAARGRRAGARPQLQVPPAARRVQPDRRGCQRDAAGIGRHQPARRRDAADRWSGCARGEHARRRATGPAVGAGPVLRLHAGRFLLQGPAHAAGAVPVLRGDAAQAGRVGADPRRSPGGAVAQGLRLLGRAGRGRRAGRGGSRERRGGMRGGGGACGVERTAGRLRRRVGAERRRLPFRHHLRRGVRRPVGGAGRRPAAHQGAGPFAGGRGRLRGPAGSVRQQRPAGRDARRSRAQAGGALCGSPGGTTAGADRRQRRLPAGGRPARSRHRHRRGGGSPRGGGGAPAARRAGSCRHPGLPGPRGGGSRAGAGRRRRARGAHPPPRRRRPSDRRGANGRLRRHHRLRGPFPA